MLSAAGRGRFFFLFSSSVGRYGGRRQGIPTRIDHFDLGLDIYGHVKKNPAAATMNQMDRMQRDNKDEITLTRPPIHGPTGA